MFGHSGSILTNKAKTGDASDFCTQDIFSCDRRTGSLAPGSQAPLFSDGTIRISGAMLVFWRTS